MPIIVTPIQFHSGCCRRRSSFRSANFPFSLLSCLLGGLEKRWVRRLRFCAVQWLSLERRAAHESIFNLLLFCCYDALLLRVGWDSFPGGQKSVIVYSVVVHVALLFANTHCSVKAQLHRIPLLLLLLPRHPSRSFSRTLFLCM